MNTNSGTPKRLTSPASQKAKSELQKALDYISKGSDVKAIALTKGQVAFVDVEDYLFIAGFEWQFRDGYAKRTPYGDNKVLSMHNAIMLPPEGYEVDHIDGDAGLICVFANISRIHGIVNR